MTTPDDLARRLAAEAIADGDPTAWFERIYAAAQAGQTAVPWDRGAPVRLLLDWAAATGGLRGAGRRAVVVGCGLGADAEFIAGCGFDTTGFDISPTAIQGARQRHPGSPVHYATADLLHLPADWQQAFDLVFESNTLQALPEPPRGAAIAAIGTLVAPGGTLLALARAREPAEPDDGPPWALTRTEIDALAGSGLSPVRIEDLREPGPLPARRWRAELTRPARSSDSRP
jgi:SAM-dependent methyltransferase